MQSGRSIPFVIFAMLTFVAPPLWAEEEEDAKPRGGAAQPRWEGGARAYFVTANPILSYSYEEYESVNGFIVGPTLQRRSNDGSTRLIIGLDYTRTSPEDGAWLAQGDDPPDAEWTEFRNFSIISANVSFVHVIGRGPFGFTFGGGLGLSVVQGSITSWPVDADGRKVSSAEPDEKDVPGITPVILLKMGPQFEMGKIGTVNLDVGFHHGFFAGAAFSANLPF